MLRTTHLAMRVALLSAALLGGLAAPASAQERAADLARPVERSGPHHDDASLFHLDIDASTMLPLVVGATVDFEVPGHIVIRAGGGFVPSAYVDAINDVATGWGAYDDGAAQTAHLLLDDATFLELGLGWRPAGTPGIELDVSYALLWTHRRIDMAQLGGVAHDAGLDLTIDAIHAELAYQAEPIDHVFFRIALGWAHAFDHHVALAGQGDDTQQAAFHGAADQLAATVGRYAFGPTLAMQVGVRF